jgi:uncharacterized membrane protein YdjX (TVP38/TMEM64 family)
MPRDSVVPSRVLTAFALLIVVLLVLATVALASPSNILSDPQILLEWLQSWGRSAPLALIVLQMAQVLIAPLPGQLLGVVSGFAFGALLGTLYSLLGTALGCLLGFLAVRRFGRPLAQALVPADILARVDRGASRHGAAFLVAVFLLPFLPDDLVCLAAGLTPMPLPMLMAAVVVGRTPSLLASAWLGATATTLAPVQWTALIAFSVAGGVGLLLFGERLQLHAMELFSRWFARRQVD